MSKSPPTQAEIDYMAKVKELPCACCSAEGPSEAHHIRIDQGKSQRAGNYLVIPLCRSCHGEDLGSMGIHGNKTLLRIYRTSEIEMLNDTIGKMVRL